MRYWINTVSRDHEADGCRGWIYSGGSGRQSRLRRLGKGDTGWRRSMKYFATEDAPIQPLMEQLEFITNKKSWGFPFRRGMFEIGEAAGRQIAIANI